MFVLLKYLTFYDYSNKQANKNRKKAINFV